MTNHVSGKLSMSPGTHILTEDGKSIAQLNYGYDLPVQEANGRRLVACWNACAGASTEILESGAVNDWALLMTDLEKQRDQLLAALLLARETLDEVQGDINPSRGYADDLEADVLAALGVVSSAIAACEVQS